MESTIPVLHPDPSSWPANAITLAWLGHATVLMRLFDHWVITDPALGRRIGPSLGPVQIGPKRLSPPALRVGDLPPIDAVLVSHAHFDHLDKRTLRRLPRSAVAITATGVASLLPRFNDVRQLAWGETTTVGAIAIRATPAKHWGARMIGDRHRGYCGFLFTVRGRRILFTGDTAATDLLAPLAAEGPVDIMIVPIGAYDPWIANHCSPEQAWAMAAQLGARAVVPVHHSTFRLSREPTDDPLRRIVAAAGADRDRIVITTIGQTWSTF